MNSSASRRSSSIRFTSETLVAIHVTDLRKAKQFYSEVLGFDLIEKKKNQLVYKTGDLTLYVNRDTAVMPYIPALGVEDINAAREYLQKAGCKITRQWPKYKAFYFTDPFGIVIDVHEKP